MLSKKAKTTHTDKKGNKSAEKDRWNVDDIQLEGEEDESVPIYDTCDNVRQKITAHTRIKGITQAAFLREITGTFPS